MPALKQFPDFNESTHTAEHTPAAQHECLRSALSARTRSQASWLKFEAPLSQRALFWCTRVHRGAELGLCLRQH